MALPETSPGSKSMKNHVKNHFRNVISSSFPAAETLSSRSVVDVLIRYFLQIFSFILVYFHANIS